PMDLKRGVDMAVAAVVNDLKVNSKKVAKDQIAQVGTISANGDEVVGKKIAEAMEKVGSEGVITVEESNQFDFLLYVLECMQFDRGFLSSIFFISTHKMIVKL